MMYRLLFLTAVCQLCFLRGQTQHIPALMNDTLWSYNIKGYPVEIPLIDDQSVFLGADGSGLRCIDKKSGLEKWKLQAGLSHQGFIHSLREDSKGSLFANGISKNIIAVHKSNGKLRWQYECKFDDDLFSVITVIGHAIYVNPAAAEFLSLSTDGELRWKTNLPGPCLSYTIQGDMIYAQVGSGTFVINRHNGLAKKVISFTAGNRSPFPPVCTGNKILIHHHDSLACFELKTFRDLWVVSGISGISSAEDQVFAFSDKMIKKIDTENGAPIWETEGEFNWYIQPVVYRSSVYIQSRYKFYILDAQSGKLQYLSPFPYKSYTKPHIEADKIYAGIGGKFVCMRNPLAKKKR